MQQRQRARRSCEREVLLMWWRAYQIAVVVFFLVADVYFEWGAGGLAAGVIGGMVAWWSSVIIARILDATGLGSRSDFEEAPVLELLYRPPDAPPLQRKKRPARSGRT